MSSLEPKPPPIGGWMMRMRAGSMLRISANSRLCRKGTWVLEYISRLPEASNSAMMPDTPMQQCVT
jgi:hypothetical protein